MPERLLIVGILYFGLGGVSIFYAYALSFGTATALHFALNPGNVLFLVGVGMLNGWRWSRPSALLCNLAIFSLCLYGSFVYFRLPEGQRALTLDIGAEHPIALHPDKLLLVPLLLLAVSHAILCTPVARQYFQGAGGGEQGAGGG